MRIRYIGLDNRPRVAEASRVKFLENGFQATDAFAERDDSVKGPLVVAHVARNKGGKRLIMQLPDVYDIEGAMVQLLEKGWLDLSDCTVKIENQY